MKNTISYRNIDANLNPTELMTLLTLITKDPTTLKSDERELVSKYLKGSDVFINDDELEQTAI